MNVFRTSAASRSSNHTRNESYASSAPSARVLVDSYSNAPDRMNGGPRTGFASKFASNDVQDPVSMHLLMENALGDSRVYQVLAPEEVDSIKRELSVLANRIEAAQRKLVLETKVRDATQSMGRLQRPTNGSGRGAEDGAESVRKCEELGQELWRLEKQEQQLQKVLLEHTAGVLQATHKGYLKDKSTAEKMRNGNDFEDDYEFGGLSHYRPSSLSLDDLISSSGDSEQQNHMILGVERRVEELNMRLREMITASKSPRDQMPQAPRELHEDPNNPGDILFEQIDYLERCFDLVQGMQGSQGQSSVQVGAAEDALERLNMQMFQSLSMGGSEAGSALRRPPEADGKGLQTQIEYLSKAFNAASQQLEKSERYESVIGGLWSSLASPDETDDFSLQRFSAKVQEMQIRYSNLQSQKDVLTRQVQQQRELNETGDKAKDSKIHDLTNELDATRGELENTRQETNIHLEKLTSAMGELQIAKAAVEGSNQQRGTAESQALSQERESRAAAEDQLQRARAELEETKRLMKANDLALKSDLEANAAAASKAQNETNELEGEVVRLRTELTIAQAELDSAHGSRAQRAAEAAGDPVLTARIQTLQSELSETISDYEAMTKATIDYEKEREQLESVADGMRDRIETLESQLSDEKIQSLGVKSPGTSEGSRGGAAGATSAGVLRNEFKKMMREAKNDHSKALRAEQEERKKLEAQLRTMKKDQLPVRRTVK